MKYIDTKYIIISGLTIIISLLFSKVFIALKLIHFDKYKVNSTQQKSNISQLQQTGKSIYSVYCTSCHGQDGKGNNNKAQDHTKRMAKKSILDVINNGSNNFKSIYSMGMPANLVNTLEAEKIATYLYNGLQGAKPKFWERCISCHGDNAKGIPFIAPNLIKYSDDLVSTVLINGKKGIIGTMPSFATQLSSTQMKAVAVYIRSLENKKLHK
jgi:cytochrome c oxidase cbb3-type subunit 3